MQTNHISVAIPRFLYVRRAVKKNTCETVRPSRERTIGLTH